MTSAHWFLLVGALLLTRGLCSPLFARLPVTPAILYLAVGLVVGPTLLNVFHFNPLRESALLEVLTEVALLISLFSAGIKMPASPSLASWQVPVRLASLSMIISVGLVAAFSHYLLGLPIGAGILLGAILAPTDPVLATDVQIRHPGDSDQLRFTLSCEAGMNDGSAFPFVMLGLGLLGLHDLGDAGLRWVLIDIVWATLAGIAIGVAGGTALAHVARSLRGPSSGHKLMDDLLGLGLIGVVYGLSVLLGAWGFLAVFFAAVALRQTELDLLGRTRADNPPGQVSAAVEASQDIGSAQSVSGGSLIFKEHLERLSEMVLILLVGGTLFVDSWSWRAVWLALFLFVVARPLSVMLGLLGARVSWSIRGMTGWFGVRGIGSLFYLMYAIEHGLPENLALELIQFTLVTVTLSILVHGISVKPLMNHFWQRHHRPPESG